MFLSWRPGAELGSARSIPVTTDLLGRTAVADLPYENPDGSPLWIDVDLLGRERSKENPTPGPFESPQPVEQKLQLEGF